MLSMFFCACTNNIQKDTQKNLSLHKEFFKTLSFTGFSKKKYCEECNFNKYQIILKLEKINPNKIALGNKSFQPYYFFSSESELNISVNQSLYNAIRTGSFVEKKVDADYLVVDNQKYILFSEDKYKWLPD